MYVCMKFVLSLQDHSYKQKVKDIAEIALFPELGLPNEVGHTGGAGRVVIVRDLDLFSYCESVLAPVSGQVSCRICAIL
ncbi:hypothetical protein GOBAR_AA33697 [Gossypium barbadense]|uniref:Uncharacterized protein n=1 Tax=Gossypium barbadense TaxID=3634 RepID=A0A2P5W7D3_GOSBA|nr:hypothetical protein GOBAR_AA33697 [Gossypium barbadense]